MASTLTTFSSFLKESYPYDKVEETIGKNRPLLGMLNKPGKLTGELTAIPVIYGRPQGIAGQSRSIAQGAESNLKGVQFQVTAGDYFASVYIGNKIMKASRNNTGAWLQNRQAETDALYEQVSDNMSTYLYGNGGGSLGVISSISTDVITLTNPEDAIHFEVGMTCALSENDGATGTDSLQSGTFTLAGVDRATGTITGTAGEIAALTGEDAGDYIFRYGDFNGNTGTVILKGLGAQFPGTASPAALYGVTRTVDPTRLAGAFVPSAALTNKNMEERIQLLATYMHGRYRGGVPSTAFMHSEDWLQLSFILANRGTRPLTDTSGKFGYQYLELATPGGMQKIYADPFCPKKSYFALDLNDLVLDSMGDFISVLEEDGNVILRGSNNDNFEYRLFSFPALYHRKPSAHGRVTLYT